MCMALDSTRGRHRVQKGIEGTGHLRCHRAGDPPGGSVPRIHPASYEGQPRRRRLVSSSGEPCTPHPVPALETGRLRSRGAGPLTSTGSGEGPSRLFKRLGPQASPGWWPRPFRLRLRPHGAPPLRLQLLSCLFLSLDLGPPRCRRSRSELLDGHGFGVTTWSRTALGTHTCRVGGLSRCPGPRGLLG